MKTTLVMVGVLTIVFVLFVIKYAYTNKKRIEKRSNPMANGCVKAKTGDSTTDMVYTNWYKSVYSPTVAVEETVATLSATTSTKATSTPTSKA